MSNYQDQKEKLIEEAKEWQIDFDNHNYSYYELAIIQNRFLNRARRLGLIKEFRENGII